jgi:integrase/recombinase XerD
MSVDLTQAAEAWLDERHARGYVLKDHRWLIASFFGELADRNVTQITVADALAFACKNPASTKGWQAARLRAVAGLAAYVHDLDSEAAEVIPAGLIRARVRRRLPYLYTPEQIEQLMAAAKSLAPWRFALSVRTLIGLLAVTGMRSGEALALNVEDLHVDEALLVVTGKYSRQRLVPLAPSTLDALLSYHAQRPGRHLAIPGRPLLFGACGGRLNDDKARAAFNRLVSECRLPARPRCRAPRLHDFRHSFAVNTLIDAHRQGVDIDACLTTLAAFLGHVDPTGTYWYLTASPELMAAVADRADTHARRCQP